MLAVKLAGHHFPAVLHRFIVRKLHGLSSLPDTLENITAIREDPDIQVCGQDGVEATNLLISEECVGHPHFARFCHCQVTDFI